MEWEIRRAEPCDLELVVRLRMEVLLEANGLAEAKAEALPRRQCEQYFTSALGSGRQTTLLAYAGGRVAGCGSICYSRLMPTCDNPSGMCATLMNVYIRRQYRGNGGGKALVKALLEDALCRAPLRVALEATKAGRPLYSSLGFQAAANEMELFLP